MKKALYPGVFDPVTYGHLDIIRRAADIFDELIVGVLNNRTKSPVFTPEERADMIRAEAGDLANVTVKTFDGLLVDFAREENIKCIIRGLRAVTDFDYELQMTQTNKVIAPGIDTIFMPSAMEYTYLSSSVVREIASYGGDISKFVTPRVAALTKERFGAVSGR